MAAQKTDAAVADDVAITSALVERAEALRAEGVPGVALWKQLLTEAASANAARTDLSPTERLDATVAQTTAVLVGPNASVHLGTFERLARFIPGAGDPFARTLRARVDEVKQAGSALTKPRRLDPTEAADFRPDFNDGTRGLIAHTHFYVFLGYAIAGRDPLVSHLPNIWHETLDPSSSHKSEADWLVGAWGVEVGRLLRGLRDAGDAEAALAALPSIVSGAFGKAPAGADAVAREVRDVVDAHLQQPAEGDFLGRAVNALGRAAGSVAARLS